MYSEQEKTLIAQLSPELQEFSKDPSYSSHFENYCAHSVLPVLPEGTVVEWAEFYYSDDPDPAFFFVNGQLNSVNCEDIPDPSTLQIVGVDGSLYIQVKGHVLLNRIRFAKLPSFSSQKITDEMNRLEKLVAA